MTPLKLYAAMIAAICGWTIFNNLSIYWHAERARASASAVGSVLFEQMNEGHRQRMALIDQRAPQEQIESAQRHSEEQQKELERQDDIASREFLRASTSKRIITVALVAWAVHLALLLDWSVIARTIRRKKRREGAAA